MKMTLKRMFNSKMKKNPKNEYDLKINMTLKMRRNSKIETTKNRHAQNLSVFPKRGIQGEGGKTCFHTALFSHPKFLSVFFKPNIFSPPNFVSDPEWTSMKTIFGGRKKCFWTWGFLNWQGQRFYFNWSLTIKTKSCWCLHTQSPGVSGQKKKLWLPISLRSQNEIRQEIWKQAEAELGQAQLKLALNLTLIFCRFSFNGYSLV